MWSLIPILFAASQVYWAARIFRWGKRRIPKPLHLAAAAMAVLAVYAFLFAYTFGYFEKHTPTHLTAGEALFTAPFDWWIAASVFGFLAAILVSPLRLFGRGRKDIESPERRVFLERATNAAVASPFVLGAYGLLYGRLNLETTAPRIRIAAAAQGA